MPDSGASSNTPASVVAVLLPLPLAGAYDYAVPADLAVAEGDFVVVPLGPRQVIGVVWGDHQGDVDPAKLRPILERLDAPAMSEPLRRFVDWVAGYTLQPPGAVLRMCMSVPAALEPPKPVIAYRWNGAEPERATQARQRVLAVAADGPPRTARDLAELAGVGAGVVKGLRDAGVLEAVELPAAPPFRLPDLDRPGPELSADQATAAADLVDKVKQGGFSVTLLDGVTGSGKTEVYFEAVIQALRRGGQVLVLLPEIALSAQWLDRFSARFGVEPAAWHSDLSQVMRRRTWRAVAEGEAKVVVGARSALYLPFPDLKLIVIDEEHDTSFKQDDGVAYHARDMAVVRASLTGVPAVLVSATPSLESRVNADQGRYHRLQLRERHGRAVLPSVELIDMRQTPPGPGSWLSPSLLVALDETFAAGEQAMLFLNRRGYAPLTLCGRCGHRLKCPNCSAWLVEHRLARRLQCHHCGFLTPSPRECPECEAEESLRACGPGVERLAEEVAERFGDIRLGLMTSDNIHGPAEAEAFVRAVAGHELDLIIGTQIVAKGHHFPMLTLVGVIDADLGLDGGDMRAAERTFQLLTQVAGRAGRADRRGRALVQTYQPGHPVMQALAAGDGDGFAARELAERERARMPPYGRLVALVLSGRDLSAVEGAARDLAAKAPRDKVRVLGPAPALLAQIRGRHRYRLLLKAPRDIAVQPILAAWLARVRLPNAVRLQVDVDPHSFM